MNIHLLSDDIRRSKSLTHDFEGLGRWLLYDLWNDECVPNVTPEVIVVDIRSPESAMLWRLRTYLKSFSTRGAPLLWLVHENSARAQVQANALQARHILEYERLGFTLPGIINKLNDGVRKATAEKMAGEARDFLTAMFRDAPAVTVDQVVSGTSLVTRAIAETSIGEWLQVVWDFDDVTHQHCLLVAGLAAAFAQSLGTSERDCSRLTQAALLHDIGKVAIPTTILNKPSSLTRDEMQVMRTHAAHGYLMLQGRGFEPEMLQVVRSHHEMLDGSGYPDGLIGSQISDLVRLVTICDIYAALIERRPYRAPMSMSRAYEILIDMSGRLDPDLVRAFKPIAQAFDPI